MCLGCSTTVLFPTPDTRLYLLAAALGSATISRAEERRVENLKKLGYNAIRTSHNPVSPAFLDACDKYGVLVMHEAFDCFDQGKNSNDYHVYFDDWWQRDLASMVKRSINHPSIVLWSIGNEIPMRETTAGQKLYHDLAAEVRSIDPTRFVSSAIPEVKCVFPIAIGPLWVLI